MLRMDSEDKIQFFARDLCPRSCIPIGNCVTVCKGGEWYHAGCNRDRGHIAYIEKAGYRCCLFCPSILYHDPPYSRTMILQSSRSEKMLVVITAVLQRESNVMRKRWRMWLGSTPRSIRWKTFLTYGTQRVGGLQEHSSKFWGQHEWWTREMAESMKISGAVHCRDGKPEHILRAKRRFRRLLLVYRGDHEQILGERRTCVDKYFSRKETLSFSDMNRYLGGMLRTRAPEYTIYSAGASTHGY